MKREIIDVHGDEIGIGPGWIDLHIGDNMMSAPSRFTIEQAETLMAGMREAIARARVLSGEAPDQAATIVSLDDSETRRALAGLSDETRAAAEEFIRLHQAPTACLKAKNDNPRRLTLHWSNENGYLMFCWEREHGAPSWWLTAREIPKQPSRYLPEEFRANGAYCGPKPESQLGFGKIERASEFLQRFKPTLIPKESGGVFVDLDPKHP